jgi:hypothetical protein
MVVIPCLIHGYIVASMISLSVLVSVIYSSYSKDRLVTTMLINLMIGVLVMYLNSSTISWGTLCMRLIRLFLFSSALVFWLVFAGLGYLVCFLLPYLLFPAKSNVLCPGGIKPLFWGHKWLLQWAFLLISPYSILNGAGPPPRIGLSELGIGGNGSLGICSVASI